MSTDVAQAILLLEAITLDLSEAIDALEDAPSSQLIYVDLPLLTLTSCVARLGQLVYPKAAA